MLKAIKEVTNVSPRIPLGSHTLYPSHYTLKVSLPSYFPIRSNVHTNTSRAYFGSLTKKKKKCETYDGKAGYEKFIVINANL